MQIIIHDNVTGKEFMIKGHGLDYEIFQKSKGKMVDGELKGAGNWISARNYPSTFPSAVYKCINWILADPDDTDEVTVEADKARIKLGKILKDRVDSIVAEVVKETE